MDIVDRLKSPANTFYQYHVDGGAMIREAAETIESLREELQNSIPKHEVWDAISEKNAKYIPEIERLRKSLAAKDAEIEHWKSLEREAAAYVESVICMYSPNFTGDDPYVGWKGLGLALKRDYEEMNRMREAFKEINAHMRTVDKYGLKESTVELLESDNE